MKENCRNNRQTVAGEQTVGGMGRFRHLEKYDFPKVWLCLMGLVVVLTACNQDKSPAESSSANDRSADPHARHTMPMATDTMATDTMATETKTDTVPASQGLTLNTLLLPTQATVISQVRTIKPERKDRIISFLTPGRISYDTRNMYGVSLLYAGRIEKLHAKYNFQPVRKGQLLMEIYSPELLTAQQNLLFLLENDTQAADLIAASEKNLRLLGLTSGQIKQLHRTRKPYYSLPVYSPYNGYLQDASSPMPSQPAGGAQVAGGAMTPAELTTRPLSLREGMYVQKGQTVFRLYDNSRVWAILDIYQADADKVQKGQTTELTLESRPEEKIIGTIDFIEPFYAQNATSLRARVYLPNPDRSIRIGALVSAKVSSGKKNTLWIPRTAVYDLGQDKVVWVSAADRSFTARRIQTGVTYNDWVEVKNGVSAADVLAADAQFLIDSESFIRISQR